MILLMTSEMEWVEQIYAEPYADSFQQLYLHAKRVREFSVRPIEKRYDELWGEAYFGVRGASGLFEIFSMAGSPAYASLPLCSNTLRSTKITTAIHTKIADTANAPVKSYP